MKHYTKILYFIAGVLAAAGISACSDIKEEDRFIEMPVVEAKRTVLLEEYTGQKCVNCPTAHSVIADLHNTFGDNLIAVSIHGGGDAFSYDPKKFPFSLATDDSQAYCKESGASSLPAGVVNRTSGVTNYDQWATLIRKALDEPSKLEIMAEASIGADGKTINIGTIVLPHDNIDANLQLWVVESGIRSIQLTPTGLVSDYEHNHVFRAAVNGHDGDKVHLVIRESSQYNHTIAIDERWNTENLSVVAFIYNDDGVLQATQCSVAKAP